MRVSIDIDCTPEEARRFLGLPDLSPLHEAWLERMKGAMSEQPALEMMKAWGPMNEAGVSLWRQMLDQMSRKSDS